MLTCFMTDVALDMYKNFYEQIKKAVSLEVKLFIEIKILFLLVKKLVQIVFVIK